MSTADRFLGAAIWQARRGLRERGIPIGAALVIDDVVVGIGRNRRVQRGSAILHAEIDCLRNAGRLSPQDYRRATLYSTLSPCDMCSGAILLFGIPTVVVGEARTFTGPEGYLRSRGVEIHVMDDPACKALMDAFLADDANASLWKEDIGSLV
jgi:cytosine deaminase